MTDDLGSTNHVTTLDQEDTWPYIGGVIEGILTLDKCAQHRLLQPGLLLELSEF